MAFSAWNAAPSVQDVEAFMALAQSLSATYAQNSNVTLVLSNTEVPGAKARAALHNVEYTGPFRGVRTLARNSVAKHGAHAAGGSVMSTPAAHDHAPAHPPRTQTHRDRRRTTGGGAKVARQCAEPTYGPW
jgi:hypothetical protein